MTTSNTNTLLGGPFDGLSDYHAGPDVIYLAHPIVDEGEQRLAAWAIYYRSSPTLFTYAGSAPPGSNEGDWETIAEAAKERT
ncbi:hypothetical protein Pan216_30050 [Planctomycetes bacterium Pan216]|uniref:Uncharacterized protein n=1 Tax=Kolteria novifilia TaxID=2527975 RepID=A0A518B584_9BACT|nr:hypothetical protein Pan216_30050 [Planctomycetes bacterium Pan216]